MNWWGYFHDFDEQAVSVWQSRLESVHLDKMYLLSPFLSHCCQLSHPPFSLFCSLLCHFHPLCDVRTSIHLYASHIIVCCVLMSSRIFVLSAVFVHPLRSSHFSIWAEREYSPPCHSPRPLWWWFSFPELAPPAHLLGTTVSVTRTLSLLHIPSFQP